MILRCAMLAALLLFSSSAPARSGAARAAFKRQNPCPSTGARRGTCPGYVIDHVKPLACGGADAVSNMQWQTVKDAKEKDRWELRVYCPWKVKRRPG